MPKGHEKEVSKTIPQQSGQYPKESKDVSNALTILDNQDLKTNPFGANITGENAYKRAERISAALHLITNLVPEVEPLRLETRRQSLVVLSRILELRAGFRTSPDRVQEVLATIRELLSCARLLAVAGYVSTQNVSVIVEALDELGSLIVVSQRSTLAEQMTMEREDLVPPPHQDISYRTDKMAHSKRTPRVKDTKDVIDTNGTSSSARSDQIMDMLKLGGILGIKDISANLPQYSEKMIQRELAELVLLNKVRKMGAKRWSRYQIAL